MYIQTYLSRPICYKANLSISFIPFGNPILHIQFYRKWNFNMILHKMHKMMSHANNSYALHMQIVLSYPSIIM